VQARLLVADSGEGSLADLILELEREGYRVDRVDLRHLTADRIEELREIGEGPEAILIELGEARAPLPDRGALPDDVAVVALRSPGSSRRSVDALRLGADDAVALPVDPEELALRLARAIERRRPFRDPGRRRSVGEGPATLLGTSAALQEIREQIERVAQGTATVLIRGETGTGKELVATAIHEQSPRRRRPFLKVNCAALPETLLESELFGYERGAFTGADHRRTGRFEEADGGTLLLDEVGDMHPRTQAKVLRVLQEQEFERLGGSRPIRVDVRIVAATNQDLEELIEAGRFRADLFFRLNVISMHLLPLRERREDIGYLAEVFLREFNRDALVPKRGFSPSALQRIVTQAWPGNVRELRNVVQRAVLMGEGPWLEPGDLALRESPPSEPVASEDSESLVSLPPEGVDYRDAERALIVAALKRTHWVQKEAAELLRMSRRRLNYRIRRLGISHPSWRVNRPGGEA
jgi:DNA-binding NtrC family response regulator